MKTPFLLVLTAALLAGCGVKQSRINPYNWFDHSQERPSLEPETGYEKVVADNRAVSASITDMVLEPVHGGQVLRVTAVAPTQGWWDAELRPLEQAGAFKGEAVDGVLGFELVLSEPLEPALTGAPATREVAVAAFISRYDLDGVSQITVAAANGTRSLRP